MHKYKLNRVDIGEYDNIYFFDCNVDECDNYIEAFAVDGDFLYLHSDKHPGWVKANDVLDEENFKSVAKAITLFVMNCSSCGEKNNEKFITITDRILCNDCREESITVNDWWV